MFRSALTFSIVIVFLLPIVLQSAHNFEEYENQYEIANREKDYAFKLIPEFYEVLKGGRGVPSYRFNYIKWKYRTEIRRHPHNPFLLFCLGELYREINEYEKAFEYYERAIDGVGDNIFKHILLLELFSKRKLWQFQMKEEKELLQLKRNLGALSLPILSEYFFVKSIKVLKSGVEKNEVERNLRISEELDPYDLNVRLFYTKFLLKNKRFEFFDEFLGFLHILFLDFKTRIYLIIYSFNFLFMIVGMLLIAFVTAFFIKYFPFSVSKLTIIVPGSLSIHLRYFIAITILIIPLIWTLPSIYTLVYMLLIAVPFMEKRERWSVQVLLFILFIVSLFGSFQTKAYTAVDPSNEIEIIDNINKSRFEPRWVRKCDSLISITTDDFSPYFLKGLQLKRGGYFDDAEENYRKAGFYTQDRCEIYNNLGNVLFWKEGVDSSIKYYKMAISSKSEESAPHYNIAQAYIRKLQFDKSTREMKLASQLNFDLIREHTRHAEEKNNKFLIDMLLPSKTYFTHFFSLEQDENVFPWKYIGFDYKMFMTFLAVLFVLCMVLPRIVKNVKGTCPVCFSPISKGNSKQYENETLCWKCYRKLSALHSTDIKERLRVKIGDDARLTSAYTVIFWGLFFPGLGHLQLGKIKTATFYLISISILVSIILIDRVTGIASLLPFSEEGHFNMYIIVLLVILLYLFSLLNLFGISYEQNR
jgi:tetratricopeptide (TPR) repeat protein